MRVDNRTKRFDNYSEMSDQDEFIRRLRKFARKANVLVSVDRSKGKGSHARVKYGNRVATVPAILEQGFAEKF